MSWTAREDETEAAAVVLASDGAYDGPVTLTASSAPTFAEVAAIASALTGQTVERVVVDENEWLAAQVAAGQPEFIVRFRLVMHQAAQQGFFAGADPLRTTLLGRGPRSVRDVLTASPTPH